MLDVINLDDFIVILGYIKIRYTTYISIEVVKLMRLVCKKFKDYIDSVALWHKIYQYIYMHNHIMFGDPLYKNYSLNASNKFLYHYKTFMYWSSINRYNATLITNFGVFNTYANITGKFSIYDKISVIYSCSEEVMNIDMNYKRINFSTYSGKIYEYTMDIRPELQQAQEVVLPKCLRVARFIPCKLFTVAICYENDMYAAYGWMLLERYDDKFIRTNAIWLFNVISSESMYSDFNSEVEIYIDKKLHQIIKYNDILNIICREHFSKLSETERKLYKIYSQYIQNNYT